MTTVAYDPVTARGPAGVPHARAASRSAKPDEVSLWICANDDLGPGIATTLAGHWLDEHELATAARFVFERDRRQYLVAHALTRRLLSLETGIPEADLELWRSSRGRPFVCPPEDGWLRSPGSLDFNLSHSHGYNAIAVARDRRVGVDVERLDRIGERSLAGIADSFTPWERQWLDGHAEGPARDRAVLRLWTLKEAYSKARGLGLGLPFDSFGFVPGKDGVVAFQPPADDPHTRWRFLELEPLPHVLVAVAVESGTLPLREVHVHTGFPWRSAAPRESLPAGADTPLLPVGALGTAEPAPGTPSTPDRTDTQLWSAA